MIINSSYNSCFLLINSCYIFTQLSVPKNILNKPCEVKHIRLFNISSVQYKYFRGGNTNKFRQKIVFQTKTH